MSRIPGQPSERQRLSGAAQQPTRRQFMATLGALGRWPAQFSYIEQANAATQP